MIDLIPEHFYICADIGILAILITGAFILMKNNKKLKDLNQRLRILAGVKKEQGL